MMRKVAKQVPSDGPSAELMLWDSRWQGAHGIARFAGETRARLASPLTDLQPSRIRPASPFDPAYLRAEASSSRAAVLVSPGFNASLPGGFRQLLTVHDLIHLTDPDETSRAKRAYYNYVLRPAIRRAGRVLTVSEYSRTLIAEWSGLDLENVVNVGNGCSVPIAAVDGTEPVSGAVLYVGNERPHKRFELLVAAAAHLPSDIRITTVGIGEDRLQRLCAMHHVSRKRFVVHGRLSDDELAEAYSAAGCLVVPSRDEGFGLIALEAMARGVPSVFSADAVGEVVGDTGFRVSTAEPAEWAAVIVTALQSSGSRASACLERAGTFKWDEVASKFDQAIQTFGLS